MQATFQKHVDNAVSKTINIPSSATKEDIKKVILLAWKLKCKGLTIYRSGSREEEVLCLDKTKVKDNIVDWIDTENAFYESKSPAVIYKVHSGCGKFYVIIGHDKEEPTMILWRGTVLVDVMQTWLQWGVRFLRVWNGEHRQRTM